jgi:signal transduction histidine kinase
VTAFSEAGGGRWTLRRWLAFAAVAAAATAALAIFSGAVGIVRLADARERLADELDPSANAAQQLSAALVNQETGLRGYVLARDPVYLEPYTDGIAAQDENLAALRTLLADRYPIATADLNAVETAAGRWRTEYAQPTIDGVRAGQPAASRPADDLGRDLFDTVRARLDAQEAYLSALRAESRAQLADAAQSLERIAMGIGVVLLLGLAILVVGLRRGVTEPIAALANQVRAVAAGDFRRRVRGGGPAELVDLGEDVDLMRQRILEELAAAQQAHHQLDAQAQELLRSNAELEQFAYVASHDLQEPLRKVASFNQLLADRYRDRLDDRAKQYIDFSVDGAKRMQALINDLLAFSRVGRLRNESQSVPAADVLETATANLAEAISESDAKVTHGPLPTVFGDPVLLTTALQNLIANAIKFRRPDAIPEIRLTASDGGGEWVFTCADNGMGVEPEYAERIFTIFQRLHSRDAYPGTGIGLAMVRKIIEYHGGQIWLDTRSNEQGSRFQFTLPKNPPREGPDNG